MTIKNIEFGIWPISKRVRSFVRCEKCDRTQTASTPEASQGLSLEELAYVGWCETETGWLCPFDSDKGATKLIEIFDKSK